MSSTREQITEALRAGGDMTVTQLADLLEKSTRTIRFSLKVLEGSGMVEQVEDTAPVVWRYANSDDQVQVFHNTPANNAECKQILNVLADGRMYRNEIAQVTGINPKRITYLLNHMKRKELVDMEGEKSRATWGVASERGPGLKNHSVSLNAALEEQHKSPIGRYLTGAPV